jgi:hypothetical protein
MQSIHSDMLPGRPLGDDGSVRSFLSDVSNDLNALDLAEPMLPPLSMNDSHEYMNRYDQYMNRPDPWREIWLLNLPLSHAWPDLCCVHNSIFHRHRFYVCMSSAKLSFLRLHLLSVWLVLWTHTACLLPLSICILGSYHRIEMYCTDSTTAARRTSGLALQWGSFSSSWSSLASRWCVIVHSN